MHVHVCRRYSCRRYNMLSSSPTIICRPISLCASTAFFGGRPGFIGFCTLTVSEHSTKYYWVHSSYRTVSQRKGLSVRYCRKCIISQFVIAEADTKLSEVSVTVFQKHYFGSTT